MASPETAPPMIIDNGNLIPADTPVFSVNDGGIAFGHALFETMAVYRGIVFAFEEHLDRLEAGARRMGLTLAEGASIRSQLDTLIEANQLDSVAKARLRITVSPDHIVIASSTKVDHPEAAQAISVPFSRNEKSALVGLKTINYGDNMVAQKLAREAGADEALFPNTRGELCEGTWSNVFLRLKGQWITPPLTSGCLPGVTRSLILTLEDSALPPIAESAISMIDLQQVESAFLTSSIREVQPISSLDGRALPGLECPETAAFQSAYRSLIATNG